MRWVGAGADQLDLVFERDLRVIPTFGCALGLWAVEAPGELGAYDRTSSLHVGQSFETHGPLVPGSVFLPGVGDWGGERGPSTPRTDPIEPSWSTTLSTSREAALLYRLTGDRHPVHVDPEVGHGRPGSGRRCRLPSGDLLSLEARLAAPVLPGQDLVVSAEVVDTPETAFEVVAADAVIMTGTAMFA